MSIVGDSIEKIVRIEETGEMLIKDSKDGLQYYSKPQPVSQIPSSSWEKFTEALMTEQKK
jgi:hypothetical protein